MKTVGHLTPKVIKAFDLDYKPGEEITLSAQRKKHMEKHRQEFSDFDATYERIPEIIAHPDYIGRHPNGQSLEYIKRIDGNVLVAVRLCDKLNVRAEEAAAAPSGLKEMQDCHPAVVYQTKKSLLGLF